MSGNSFVVPPRSWASIENDTLLWRDRLGLSDEPYFPVMEVMEKILDNRLGLFVLQPISKSEMENAEGYTDPSGDNIYLREDVYEGAWRRQGRDRFTAAHEFGHWHMHTGIHLARLPNMSCVPAFKLSEPQANRFATELLMPAKFFSSSDCVQEVMDRHGVSHQAATCRLDYLRRHNKFKR